MRAPLLVLAWFCAGCTTSGFNTPVEVPEPLVERTAAGIEYQDLRIGSGDPIGAGARVQVHYTGELTDGRMFDSSYGRGVPVEFTLGTGEVVPGWEEGMIGMRPGGRRRIVIPPEQAYGSEGRGVIPPDATLVLDVELVEVLASG